MDWRVFAEQRLLTTWNAGTLGGVDRSGEGTLWVPIADGSQTYTTHADARLAKPVWPPNP